MAEEVRDRVTGHLHDRADRRRGLPPPPPPQSHPRNLARVRVHLPEAQHGRCGLELREGAPLHVAVARGPGLLRGGEVRAERAQPGGVRGAGVDVLDVELDDLLGCQHFRAGADVPLELEGGLGVGLLFLELPDGGVGGVGD